MPHVRRVTFKVESELGLLYARANKLVGQPVDLGLQQVGGSTYDRRFFAPRMLQTLTADQG